MTQGFTKGVPIDTDAAMTNNSNQLVPSQAAVVSYVGNKTCQTLTGDTGGALLPSTGNFNLQGSGGITIAGAGNTLTIDSNTVGGSGSRPQFLMSNGPAAGTTFTTIPLYTNTVGYTYFGGF